MFGSEISSYSTSADAPTERRAVAARSFLDLRNFGIFMVLAGAELARGREIDRLDRRSF